MELLEIITCRIHWEQYSSSSSFYTSFVGVISPRMQCALTILLPFFSSVIIFWGFFYLKSIEIWVDRKRVWYYVCSRISTHFEQKGGSVSCLLTGPNLWAELCHRQWEQGEKKRESDRTYCSFKEVDYSVLWGDAWIGYWLFSHSWCISLIITLNFSQISGTEFPVSLRFLC